MPNTQPLNVTPSIFFTAVENEFGNIDLFGSAVGMANGTTVNFLFTDAFGNSKTTTLVVVAGEFSLTNVWMGMFGAGPLDILASAAGVSAVGSLELSGNQTQAPVTLTEYVLDENTMIDVQGVAPALDPGTVLTLVIRDEQNNEVMATAEVLADGSFSVQDIDTLGLSEGVLRFDVVAQDANGVLNLTNIASLVLAGNGPQGADNTLSATEDSAYVVNAAALGYNSTQGYTLTGVKITSLPAQGTLKLNGVAVLVDTVISKADLDAGKLTYQGALNGNGSNYTSFQFKVQDSRTSNNEDTTPNKLTFNVAAVNDAAVISGTSTGAVTEAGGVANAIPGTPTATGTLTSTDVDGTANAFTAVTAGAATTGGYGTYAMTAGGVWTYTLNNTNSTVQALAAAATLTDTFTVTAADGTPRVITVTITGTNDVAVISGTTTGAVTEAGGLANATPGTPTATGTLTLIDVDGTVNSFTAVTAATATTGGFGTYTMNASGVWVYTLNNNNASVQALVNGASLTDTFTVTAADGASKTVTVTITGANDAAVISGAATGAVTEAGGLANATPGTPTATGTLTSTDIDGTANAFTAVSTATTTTGGFGTYTMTAAGVWGYSLNNSNTTVQALATGATLTDTFTVTAADGTPRVITVTITGTNDVAVISGTATGAVTEASGVANATPGTPTATGTLTSTDVDGTANAFTAVSTATTTIGGFGTYTMTASGVWSYNLNNSNTTVQALAAGATLTDTFTVTAADGTPRVITVTITGANDAAVISGAATGAVTEAGGVANGTAGIASATGTLTSTDVDGTANAFTAVTTATATTGGFGTYTMTAAGVWSYNLNNSNTTVQALATGATLTDTFTVTAADGTPRVITVTITGTNDAAVISGTATGAVTEAGGAANATPGTPNATGTLTSTDVDGTANAFTAVTTATATTGGFGTYTMTSAGVWAYNLNNSNTTVQALATGATLTDTFTVTAADGTPRVITVTITGANDAAVISGTVIGAVTEAGGVANATLGAPTATGTMTATDVDGTPNTFIGVSPGTVTTGGYGTYSMTISGVWNYMLNDNNATVQALAAGATLNDTFTVTAADGTPRVITVTITGTNDAAVISGTATGAVTEAGGVANATPGTPTATGTLTSTDVDGTANAFTAVSTATASVGGYGTYTMTSAGVWVYTLNNNNATVQALSGTQKLTDSFTVTAADGTPRVITVTVSASNDAPVVALAIPDQMAVLGTSFSYTVPAGSFTDIDSALTYTATRGDGTALPSWLTFNAATRTFSGAPNSTVDFNVTVTASDGTASISDTFLLSVAPVVNTVAISSATGIQNTFLNAGDTVTATIGFGEVVNVTGTPQLTLNIGGVLVNANYVSGSGTSNLAFSYTILPGQTDGNGISIGGNAVSLNGGTIKDAVGNNATLNFAALADNTSYKVDTTAPAVGTLTLTDTGSSPTDGITQNGTVTVGALDAGATWEYSTNGGSTWLAGSGTSFVLPAGIYAAGTVQMRQTDLAGNVQTGALIAKNAAVITVDQIAPILVDSNPGDGGYLLTMSNDLVLNFSESVAKGTGLIQLFKADGTLVQSFDAATSTALTWSGNNLTINPTVDLLASTGYYIKIAATAVKDVAGNAYAGIADATTLNFTTADGSGAIVVPVNGIMAIEDLSTIGDFNGDGYDDFIIGAGMNGLSSTGGAAFVVYGNANGTVPNLSAGSIAASAGFKIVSGQTGDYFGIAVNSAGDTNGDGLADLVVTAKYGDASYRESAYVVFGKSNASTVYATGLNLGTGFTANMGYQIKIDESYWGHAVSNAGDVNGDGLSDLLVTSDFSASRNVYVIYGKTGNQSVTLTSYTQFTPDLGYNVLSGNVTDLGQSAYGAGDVNGDGLADFIVSAPNNVTNGRGMVYVVYGNSTGTSVQLNATNGIAASQGFRILGDTGNNSSYSRFGFAVSSAGDVNGDGLADVMISSPYQPGVVGGAVYVVYGNSSGTVLDIDLPSSSGVIAASRGFQISSALAGDHLGPYGKDIASAGDINGDGLSDMIISGRDDYGSTTASTYVVYGNASGTNVAIDASGNIAASNGFKLKGAVGFAVASAGDINGDGLNDLLVSARLGSSDSYNVVLGGTQWVTAALDGAGTFAGTSGSEALIGSAGNDTITGGGGVDRFFAGRGDDTIVLTASDIANLQNNSTGQTAKTTVSGGTGFDTIRLSGGASLDLLKVSNAAAMGIDETSRIEGIERIDMATDTAANVLNISNKDVNDMAGFNQIHTGSASVDGKTWTNVSGSALSNITSYHQMVVDGGSSDTVALTANGGAWSNVGLVSNGKNQYTVYQNTTTNSQVLVQQGVTVDTQAPTLLWSTPADNDYINTANLGNNITLQFSEIVVKGNGFIQLWNKTTGQPVQAFDVSSSTLVTGWGTSTLTINPTANLAAATDYFIKISDNAIQDNSGLAYAGMNSDLQLNFSTQSADNSYAVPSSFTSASSTSSYLRSVATAGDFNGDGYDDLLVGVAGSTQSGVYVIYGNALGEGLNLDKDPVMSNGVIAADQGFKIHGADYLGTSVSGIGDVNGDGFADVLISAPSDSQGGTNAGAAFVVYGSAAPAALNLSSGTIAAARGFKVTAGSAYGALGNSVSGLGDVNGDGIGDFVMGYASANAGAGNGAAYVVYGKTNATSLTLGTDGSIAAANGFRLTGGVNENAGFSVSGAGDVNGDGLADVIVSANGALSNADGATYVIFGGATGGDMSALVAAGKGFKINGLTNSTGYQLGTSVSSAGDVNGDGYADLIVATDTDQSYTAAYVVYGGAAPTNVSLAASTIAAAKGFRILGSTANGAGLGQVSGAGDLNGDGFADVIVGSTNGSSYVVYGKATGAEVSVSTGAIAASQGFKLTYSTNITSTTAKAVSFAGDFDGDGLTDLVIAEDTDFGNSQSYKIVFGGTQWLTTPVIGNGTVNGTAASEAILGSTANDTLTGGGGVDRFFAGMGDDTFVLTAADVTNLSNVAAGQTAKSTVNGGGGFDTLRLIGGAALNFTTISNVGAMGLEENSRIESIERIDLGSDAVANTLTLTAKDVNDIAGFNIIHLGGNTATNADGRVWTNVTGTALSGTTKFHQLVVDGAVNDVVNIGNEAGWVNAGTVNNGVSNYTVWQNTAKNAQILVQSGTTVASPVSLTLANDTGTSASDFITQNGTMNVNLSVSTNTWSYSIDSGTTWAIGSGTSFVLGAGVYAANAVQVRENTPVGQTVGKYANALTVDMAAPTVAVTMSDVALALGEKSTVTFQFSESVANFDINDVAIKNSTGGAGTGGLSALTKVSDSKWTAVYTPPTETNTTGNQIVVALNGYTDVAGNNGGAGQTTFTVDTRFSSSLTAGFYGTTSSSSSSNSSVTTNAVIVNYWNPAWQGDTMRTYKNGSQIDVFTISGATNSKSLGNLTASPGDTFYSTITNNGVTYNLFNMIKVNPGTAGLTRYDSPLILDLNGDGVQTVDMEQGTMFDLQATGVAQATGWVDAHDGFLAMDLNNDGKINSGAELFGSSTLLTNGQKATDGWTALAQFDSNGDSQIDTQDAVFDVLKVWQDANGNGLTDTGELHSLKDVGVTSINLSHDNTITHQNGNLLQGVSSFTTTDGQTHEVVDAWFQTVTEGVKTPQNVESIGLQDVLKGTISGSLPMSVNPVDVLQLDAGAWTNSDRVENESSSIYAHFTHEMAHLFVDQSMTPSIL